MTVVPQSLQSKTEAARANLSELHISEDGDSPPPTITVTPASPPASAHDNSGDEDIVTEIAATAGPPLVMDEEIVQSIVSSVESAPPPEPVIDEVIPTAAHTVESAPPSEPEQVVPAALMESEPVQEKLPVESAPEPEQLSVESEQIPVESAPEPEQPSVESAPAPEQQQPVELVVAAEAVDVVESAPAAAEPEPVLEQVSNPLEQEQTKQIESVDAAETIPEPVTQPEPGSQEEAVDVKTNDQESFSAPVEPEYLEVLPELDDVSKQSEEPASSETQVDDAQQPVIVESNQEVSDEKPEEAAPVEEPVVAEQVPPRTPDVHPESPFAHSDPSVEVNEEIMDAAAEEPAEFVPIEEQTPLASEQEDSSVPGTPLIEEDVVVAIQATPRTPEAEDEVQLSEDQSMEPSELVKKNIEADEVVDGEAAPAKEFSPEEQAVAEAVADAVVSAAIEEAVHASCPDKVEKQENAVVDSEEDTIEEQQSEIIQEESEQIDTVSANTESSADPVMKNNEEFEGGGNELPAETPIVQNGQATDQHGDQVEEQSSSQQPITNGSKESAAHSPEENFSTATVTDSDKTKPEDINSVEQDTSKESATATSN
jgi:hypothetical protein